MRVRRVRPRQDAGFTRRARGKGFVYVTTSGKPATKKDVKRITALVIPPAWSDVWISNDQRGHVQAVGTDADGRTQYLYHPAWREAQDSAKFERILTLAEAIPRARRAATVDGKFTGDITERVVLATAFRLLDATGIRIGSAAHLRKSGSRGLTTLQRKHVVVKKGEVTLAFRGKSGMKQRIVIEDAELATVMRKLAAGTSRTLLLSWRDGRTRRALSPAALNEYLAGVTGGDFTAKDFRTLRGTIVAATALAQSGFSDDKRTTERFIRDAVKACARALGNTPAVARSSYIDPRVFDRYSTNRLLDTSRSPESALRALLAEIVE